VVRWGAKSYMQSHSIDFQQLVVNYLQWLGLLSSWPFSREKGHGTCLCPRMWLRGGKGMGDEDAVSPFRPGPNGIALPVPTALPTGSGLRTHREVHNETLGALVERT